MLISDFFNFNNNLLVIFNNNNNFNKDIFNKKFNKDFNKNKDVTFNFYKNSFNN